MGRSPWSDPAAAWVWGPAWGAGVSPGPSSGACRWGALVHSPEAGPPPPVLAAAALCRGGWARALPHSLGTQATGGPGGRPRRQRPCPGKQAPLGSTGGSACRGQAWRAPGEGALGGLGGRGAFRREENRLDRRPLRSRAPAGRWLEQLQEGSRRPGRASALELACEVPGGVDTQPGSHFPSRKFPTRF